MDSESKEILLIGGIAVIILYLMRPKYANASGGHPALIPLKATRDRPIKQQIGEAKIGIEAYKAAIKAGENSTTLTDLRREIYHQYQLRIRDNQKELFVYNDKNKLLYKDAR